ncbi:hypothetical protein [Dankookia sp. P2]|uniref:hypothetical protein n=1 Tax=Dankookia sp. P2 TaxID=3423955 RepID=UPI003D67BD40
MTAADCVASLRRWMPRDSLGRMLLAATAELRATDARRFGLVLKQPLPAAAGCARQAQRTGTLHAAGAHHPRRRRGPHHRDRRLPAPSPSAPRNGAPATAHDALLRNPHYRPRAEPADFLAGGKQVRIEQAGPQGHAG